MADIVRSWSRENSQGLLPDAKAQIATEEHLRLGRGGGGKHKDTSMGAIVLLWDSDIIPP
jgi:hypothetical protein